jgi:eukaryotic-like serine/threonine-protein kinase
MVLGKILGGRYQITESLSKGGFGTTYLAQDTQRPGNPICVVKQLTPARKDESTLQIAQRLFNQEADILEKLGEHDQIPRLLAYIEESQEFYLVQEYIKGHDLSQEIPPKGAQKTEAETIKLIQDILEILKFVHDNNVIHRDVKPSNIRRRQSDGKLVLIDFGAVKQIRNLEVNQQGETSFTIPIGSPGYTASEQAMGNPKMSSDIYAVGVIAIQALTGIYPIPPIGKMPVDANGEIVWRQDLEISREVADIIDKTVRYQFSQRYSCAEEVLQEIQKLSTNLPQTIPPTVPIKTQLPYTVLPDTVNEKPQKNNSQKNNYSQNNSQKNNYKIIILGTIFFFIASFGLWKFIESKNSNQQPEIKYTLYEKNKDFKINHPENWQLIDNEQNFITGDKIKFSIPKSTETDIFKEKLTIATQENFGTFDENKNNEKRKISAGQNIQNISDETITLGGKSAYKFIYTTKTGNIDLKNMKVGTLQGGQVYTITYTADTKDFDKYLAPVETMIKSFEFK